MEDSSYVNLSLQKYNELYDKAKQFDELVKLADELTDVIDATTDKFNSQSANDESVKQPKEYNSDTLNVGDKVLIKHDLDKINNFKFGYVPEMKDFEGKIVTITSMSDNYFNFKEDEEYNLNYDYRSIEKLISRK